MKFKSYYRHLELFIVLFLILIFFIYHSKEISYGLPYFWNQDEIAFQGSILSSLSLITGYFENNYNPFYVSFLNLILILNSIFVNEFLINSLNIDQIKSKIYFNTELFVFYGRLESTIITSLSIFILFLIFKKLKINYAIRISLLISFVTSIVLLNVSTIMSKNSSLLLIYLLQIYFLIKFQLKINKFNFKSYLLFGVLSSIAWGVNYWSAFISIYAVLLLHITKYKFSKLIYFLTFLAIFLLFGVIANSFFTGEKGPIYWMIPSNNLENFSLGLFLKLITTDLIEGFRIIFLTQQNIYLFLLFVPIYLLNKFTKFKKEIFIILFLVLAPIILFSLSEKMFPQLRYFAGINSVILILTAIIFNELAKNNSKYFIFILLIFNIYVISDNVKKNNQIKKITSKNNTFFKFNENITVSHSKILYLIDLNFQESLEQNKYYVKLYDNNLIKKNDITKKFYNNIKRKIIKIQNTRNIIINEPNLKKNLIYFNYTFFEIENLKLFFDFVRKDFEYVVIEKSRPFYLNNITIQNEIRSYVEDNFDLDYILFRDDKIFLNSQQSIIHYYTNTINRFDYVNKEDLNKLDVVYGTNYALYKIN